MKQRDQRLERRVCRHEQGHQQENQNRLRDPFVGEHAKPEVTKDAARQLPGLIKQHDASDVGGKAQHKDDQKCLGERTQVCGVCAERQ